MRATNQLLLNNNELWSICSVDIKYRMVHLYFMSLYIMIKKFKIAAKILYGC